MTKESENISIGFVSAWKKAEQDLLIEVEAPFVLTDENGRKNTYGLLIKDFGSKLGTLILSADDMTDFNEAHKHGYYCSALNPESYDKYRRELFIDTLNDWGYFGEESNKPNWYNGESWTK